MTTFAIDDAEHFEHEVDFSDLQASRKTPAKREPRSVQELQVHYLNFCAKRDLDYTIPAEEQIVLCDKDRRWLDAHVENVQLAKKQKRLLARGKTQILRDMLMHIRQTLGFEDHDTPVKAEATDTLPANSNLAHPKTQQNASKATKQNKLNLVQLSLF